MTTESRVLAILREEEDGLHSSLSRQVLLDHPESIELTTEENRILTRSFLRIGRPLFLPPAHETPVTFMSIPIKVSHED